MVVDKKCSGDIERLFNREFAGQFNTVLVGGALEPLYQPAQGDNDLHQLFYREDYFSSALHEIAHWCIAGEERRKLLDFGYWYNPDGRSREQQRSFESVEIKPQAMEWIFSTAAGIPFSVSADNLSAADAEASGPSRDFLGRVQQQAQAYCKYGLPERAYRFTRALQQFYRTPDPMNAELYVELCA